MAEAADCLIDLVLVGTEKVGKTSILYRYINDNYNSDYLPTMFVRRLYVQYVFTDLYIPSIPVYLTNTA